LVRVGGPNAGHQVYAEPTPYTFHHLPSGTMHSEAKLVIGAGAVLGPGVLTEIGRFGVSADRLSIDPQAMVIDQSDIAAEGGLTKEIGSTGQGVGFATSRKILRSSAKPRVQLAKDKKDLKPYVRETLPILEEAYSRGQKVFLEGTQGTGLSLHHGAYPFVTSRETTVSGCLGEAGIAPSRVRKIVMVCRSYPIRVQSPSGGTSGPIGRELDWKEISKRSGISFEALEKAEKTSTTKRQRRVAEFDWTLLRRGASLNGPTDIALTFVDYLTTKNRDARRFEQLSADTIRFIEEVERVAGAPVSLVSTRFHHRCIIDRRAW
jgi:adenylosuccinate synthase